MKRKGLNTERMMHKNGVDFWMELFTLNDLSVLSEGRSLICVFDFEVSILLQQVH
jgi:hypothetical protein